MLLSIEGLQKSFGDKLILQDISLTIEDRDRIGLIGVNGAGKSTLLNIITGKLHEDTGEVYRASNLTIGFLEQHSGLQKENTIQDEMESVFAELLDMEKKLKSMAKQLDSHPELMDEYAHLQTVFEQREGYQVAVKIKTILNGMGFEGKDTGVSIETLSGGEKTRLALAKLLLEEPNLLILDEPTNHLDFKTLNWLENYLLEYNGAILVVSHDRYFLDKIVTSVCDLEWRKLYRYPGNYSKYKKLRRERMERLQLDYEAQQKKIAAMEEYVQKNIARASTASSARGRRKALERMDVLERPPGDIKTIHLDFQAKSKPYKDVLQVKDVTVTVGDEEIQLCTGLSFELLRGDKVAVIGANGVGKSSLLKTLLGFVPKGSGKIVWGDNTKISYYEQENSNLHMEKRVIDDYWDRYPGKTEFEVRSELGKVQLTGENVFKKVSVISGGERARLAFAIIMEEKSNVLILDEPTNHLDLQSKEILEQALRAYDGTLLFVSHDRYLLNTVPDRILEIKRQGIQEYLGNYDNYMAQVQRAAALAQPEPKQNTAPEKSGKKSYRTKEQRSRDVARKQRLKEFEQAIERTEEEISALEESLLREEVYSDFVKARETADAIQQGKDSINTLYEEWEQLQEEEPEL